MRSILICPPDHYGIEYEINPWMKRSQEALPGIARSQWQRLKHELETLGCNLQCIPPQPHLPDMVFTANAGLIVGNRFIRSNFRHAERRGEEAHFEKWFAAHRYETVRLPDGLFFEGEGDALFCRDVLFCGYRFRSDVRAHQVIGDLLKCLVISVELADERFYHLDTCFCPLPDGAAIWYPAAFDPYGQQAIRHHISDLIEVIEDEAVHFACNAIVLDKKIILPEGCPQLTAVLSKRGYEPHPLPMTEFLKAGGACKCLTLLMPQRDSTSTAPADSATAE